MRPYFIENGLEWDSKERNNLYSTLEIFEAIENVTVGYLAIRENEGAIYIADIQVLSEYQNQGYGSLLIKMAKQIAQERGYSEIKLKVFKSNPVINLYSRHGFCVIAEEKYTYLCASNV